jgi:haloalkane dehalogenase
MTLGYTETSESQEITPETQAEFLDVLNIKVVDVVSNDSGGEVAQIFVARHPTRVRTLLLSNRDVDTNSPPPSFAPFWRRRRKPFWRTAFPGYWRIKPGHAPRGPWIRFYANTEDLTDEVIDYYFTPLLSLSLRKKQLNALQRLSRITLLSRSNPNSARVQRQHGYFGERQTQPST